MEREGGGGVFENPGTLVEVLHLLALEWWVHWEHIWWRRRKGVHVVVGRRGKGFFVD